MGLPNGKPMETNWLDRVLCHVIRNCVDQLARVKRDVFAEARYIEMVLVADNAEYQKFGENKQKMVDRLLNIVNTADLVRYYRTFFNIRIALVGAEVWTYDQVKIDHKAMIMQTRFLRWREKVLLPRLYNDNAHLILGGYFIDGVAGLASFGSMCSAKLSGGVNLDTDYNILGVSATLSHELGHNLGLSHDSEQRKCKCPYPKANCIMQPELSTPFPSKFSSCSRTDMMKSLQQGGGHCLYNIPIMDNLVGGPKCGNMYLEKGEQCDCGSPAQCKDPCCNPSSCKLKRGAKCSSLGPCCKNCKFLPAGTVCRPRRGECDLPEFCTGSSQDCPNNHYMKDGYTCSNGTFFCNQGFCQSADKQCQEIWGNDAKSAVKICYEVTNTVGSEYGHCGTDNDGKYVKCSAGNILCGKLQCQGGSVSNLGFNTKVVTNSLMTKGGTIVCRTAHSFLSDASNPNLILEGTKCAPNKACMERKCQDEAQFNIKSCHDTCNNKGVRH
ncbi:disintegrin and metalloproteinase domain-containing protein 12-like [Amblyraja radiata]|uniref:disintegrin and metalloproteinase domain-containing protein 12-like n=1 Tax=Amblyraja radiata TaxID=386614 RepID=UPI001403486F|nr:disintegrin and metalloproteinase domain-containing protein 12-like [Amblyraja radiata]